MSVCKLVRRASSIFPQKAGAQSHETVGFLFFCLAWHPLQKQITESGSFVVEQWARYPEVAGSIPAHIQLIKNFQVIWEKHCKLLLKINLPYTNPG